MNRQQFFEKEVAEDHAALLSEPWSKYALRTGKGHAVAKEEHTKHVTETWEEYEKRKPPQYSYIQAAFAEREAAEQTDEGAAVRRAQVSRAVIDHLMQVEKSRYDSRTKSRHCLFVDFDEYQRNLFTSERALICQEEELVRQLIVQWQRGFVEQTAAAIGCSVQLANQRDYERKQHELELLRQAEEQRERELQEQKERERQQKIEEELAERQRKEQFEAEKRLERRKREEEKRAKARAERERAKHGVDAANAESAQAETPETETTNAEGTDTEPASNQAGNAETTDTDAAIAETTDADTAGADVTDADATTAEVVDAEEPTADETDA